MVEESAECAHKQNKKKKSKKHWPINQFQWHLEQLLKPDAQNIEQTLIALIEKRAAQHLQQHEFRTQKANYFT